MKIGECIGFFDKGTNCFKSKKINISTDPFPQPENSSIWNEIINSCADLASTNAEDIRRQLAAADVELIEGLASFPDSGGTDSLFVTKANWAVETIKADKILIATGSTPFRPSGIPFDGSRVFDSDSINQVSSMKETGIFHVSRNMLILLNSGAPSLTAFL